MVVAVKKTEELLCGLARGGMTAPMPLKAVSYEIRIASGLAVVKQKRVFRNDEEHPIEATLTFPVAYDSTVSDVRAAIDGRTLVGVAKAKKKARETYEKALDEGKTTVLHEELMRGLHMVSAGNIAPGGEIVVEATSVSPLSFVENSGRLRIPLTIGAIYGTSPLIPSDDIVADGAAIDAEVMVTGADGVRVNGKDASTVTGVRTSAVIDIVVPSPRLYPVQAKMASGSWASVSFAVPEARNVPVDADVLLDSSGSMSGSKWLRATAGVRAALSECHNADRYRFWTFSNTCNLHGEAVGASAVAALSRVQQDGGGTQLAEAVHQVAESRPEANILLVTDGRSFTEIDFDRVRKTGARFTVVLVGSAAFESRVAQLAALTGGQMFVTDTGHDLEGAVAAALRSMRSAASPVKTLEKPEDKVERTIGGLRIGVEYHSGPREDVKEEVSVPAFAVGLALPALPASLAAPLAEKVGIVSHLTSIVMVDADGPTVDGVAVNRKIALAEPLEDTGFSGFGLVAAPVGTASFSASLSCSSTYIGSGMGGAMRGMFDRGPEIGGVLCAMVPEVAADGLTLLEDTPEPSSKVGKMVDAVFQGRDIDVSPAGKLADVFFDWRYVTEVINGAAAERLGDGLPHAIRVAGLPEVVALAIELGRDPLHVALALIAMHRGGVGRQVQLIVRKILGSVPEERLNLIMVALG